MIRKNFDLSLTSTPAKEMTALTASEHEKYMTHFDKIVEGWRKQLHDSADKIHGGYRSTASILLDTYDFGALDRHVKIISKRLEAEPSDSKVIPSIDIKVLMFLVKDLIEGLTHATEPERASSSGEHLQQPRNCETEHEA